MTAAPSTTAALAAREVTRTFGTGPGAVHGLRGVSLTVDPGELLVVRGPSGSGKTTLLNVLGGLDAPSSGRVWLGARELTAMRPDEVIAVRREEVGYVFQAFGLLPVLSAAENVEVPLRLRRTAPRERARRVAEALDRVGLADHAAQRPYELSGGQQQRVGIARALVAAPRVLLADEPTGQLDSATARRVMDLLRELVHTERVAAVVTTHDPELVARADRVVDLHDGELV
ncbi:putative ABC transport system ATP-binding protein [Isoptericola sp. CG 20/1183]|uniref:ABC transport system ATP-binding protein n=1 Tax=Isoptericola halotolerans TaxID=300560 RepID=A0ABX5EHP2_9MICO|nr:MULTISPECIES: ABC transporter ATP-binding protein [Isoptericola]PRZ07765.1 putative ABC transport system ATP-binding protein [Isoptericola halotolerans]PRZ07876.1 putative ABC transport system ATP-binding protein [Isoptericola sp. CG 20/1183]